MSEDISVIITSFNRRAYLGRAIRSCLKQSLARDKYEVLVVDDASTDGSRDIIEGYGEDIKPIFLKRNVGVAGASNEGIRRSIGAYIIRVDSDDYISENALMFMGEILMGNPDIGFVYCDMLRVDKDGRIVERINRDTLDLLFRYGAGIMFRKSYLEAIGLYDKKFRNAEDFDLLKRYIKNFNGYRLPLPLYRYRTHDSNMTKDKKSRKKWEIKSIKKYENKNRK